MSKIVPKFIATVKNGKVTVLDERYQDYLHTLPERCQLTISSYTPYSRRSTQQNRYMHGVVFKVIGDEIGYSPEEVKDIMKLKFLSETRIIDTREGLENITVIKETKSLTTQELEDFLEEVKQFAMIKLGIYIPDPDTIETED